MISASRIVEGAYYAMEQAGHLLNDAVVLYERNRWASSLVLAVFCLEELGKAEILLNRGIDAAANGPKTAQQVMAGGISHPTKLKWGRGPLTVTASISFWGDIPEPNAAEMAEIERQLAEAERIAFENAPGEAHAARMRALYVDLGNDGLWSRPAETSSSDAYLMVSAASIEYAVRRKKFTQPAEAIVARELERLAALLPPLPEAPQVSWPHRTRLAEWFHRFGSLRLC